MTPRKPRARAAPPPRETLDERIEKMPESDRRRWKLNRAASQWTQGQIALLRAGDLERGEAVGRAMNTIRSIAFVLNTLVDERAPEVKVQEAIRVANAVYRETRETNRRGETIAKAAAMDLVLEVAGAAWSVLNDGARVEDVEACRFRYGRSDVATTVDQGAFRAAVQAWIDCEQTKRTRGRQRGRTPDKWKATFACVRAFDLANGITTPANLRDTFRKARPNLIPLSDEWAWEHGIHLKY